MALSFQLFRRRHNALAITIYDSDGEAVVLDDGDVVRVKIGRQGLAPLLDLSATATAAGSSATATNPTTVVVAAGDAGSLPPGFYDVEAAVYDASQTALKHAEEGVVHVIDTQAGAVGA